MGKARRTRTKFHISSVKGDINDSPSEISIKDDTEISADPTINSVGNDTNKNNDSDLAMETNISREWKVVPEDDLFKNVDIDIDKLETSVQDTREERPANISISKCIKRSVAGSGINLKLKKGDKRELRRNLFIKKIDAIHQEVMKKKPKKSKAKKLVEENEKKHMYEIPSGKTLQDTTDRIKVPRLQNQSFNAKHLPTTKISKRKQKTMCKLKNKTQEMLKNIDFYNQIISDKKFQTDALGVVTNAVQKKVYADL